MRSSYIYIVTGNKEILAAFTVKYEMEDWLEDNEEFYKGLHKDFSVFRFSNLDFSVMDITEEYYE